MKNFNKTSNIKPIEGKILETMDSGGAIQKLIYKKNLWWFPDMSMYVYYVPVFWRYID